MRVVSDETLFPERRFSTPSVNDERPLLTKPEVAKRLGCHLRTVENMIAAGELPVIRYRSSVRISPRDLDEFIEKNRATAS